jgi:hypothetical protein
MAMFMVTHRLQAIRLLRCGLRQRGPWLDEPQICRAFGLRVCVNDGEGGRQVYGERGVETEAVEVEDWGFSALGVGDDCGEN